MHALLAGLAVLFAAAAVATAADAGAHVTAILAASAGALAVAASRPLWPVGEERHRSALADWRKAGPGDAAEAAALEVESARAALGRWAEADG